MRRKGDGFQDEILTLEPLPLESAISYLLPKIRQALLEEGQILFSGNFPIHYRKRVIHTNNTF